MPEKDELTPQNRLAVCLRIGEEIGIDGNWINENISENTVEGLNRFRDMWLDNRRKEEVRQGFYTPRSTFLGTRPEQNDARTPQQIFVDFLIDAGF